MAKKKGKKPIGSDDMYNGFDDGLGGGDSFDDGLGGGEYDDGLGGGDSFNDGLGGGSYDEGEIYDGLGDDPIPPPPPRPRSGGILKVILAVVIVAVVVVGGYLGISLIIGPGKGQCEELVGKLNASIKNLDLKTFAECLDTSDKNELESLVSIKDLSDEEIIHYFVQKIAKLGGNLYDWLGVLPADSLTGVLNMVSIEPKSYGLPGPSRKVKCSINVLGARTVDIVLTIKKQNGKAYIAGVSMG